MKIKWLSSGVEGETKADDLEWFEEIKDSFEDMELGNGQISIQGEILCFVTPTDATGESKSIDVDKIRKLLSED